MTARVVLLGQSVAGVFALIVLGALAVALAVADAPTWLTGIAVLVLVAGLAWVGRARPGPAMNALAITAVVAAAAGLAVHHGGVTAGVLLAAVIAVAAGLVDDPLRQRLVPRVRAAQLPGIPSDTRPQEPGPFALVAPVVAALTAILLLIDGFTHHDAVFGVVLLALTVALAVWCAVQTQTAVQDRRTGAVNRDLTQALSDYAPQFFIYFSGPVEGEYQVRMWLPHLERLGVPFAILARDEKMLRRAAAFGQVPMVVCPRLGGLDACMVPSVRAIFYVNTDFQCVDGVRYLDRTHVHLNHGDSDKPSSYHPMIAMFDQIFLAGQAAVDRFARHGVVVAPEKFRLVGRPQVADISRDNLEPLAGCTTVLYAPTWRGGVKDMSFSSLERGERIVRALVDRGVRVVFRPHPMSLKSRRDAETVARIDELLAAARTTQCPHVGSAQAMAGGISDSFNRSDALVTDVSSVASDYLQSGKPMAVADLAGTGLGQGADPTAYPVLRAAYLLDLGDDLGSGLDAMLGDDPLAATRAELRTYYLGEHVDSAQSFVDAAASAIHDTP